MGLTPDQAKIQRRFFDKQTQMLGFIDNSERGVWSLTAKGWETQHVDPKEIERLLRQREKLVNKPKLRKKPL